MTFYFYNCAFIPTFLFCDRYEHEFDVLIFNCSVHTILFFWLASLKTVRRSLKYILYGNVSHSFFLRCLVVMTTWDSAIIICLTIPNSSCPLVSLRVVTSAVRLGFYCMDPFLAIFYFEWILWSSVSCDNHLSCESNFISTSSFKISSCASFHSETTTMFPFSLLYFLYCWCGLPFLRQSDVTKVSFYFNVLFFKFSPVISSIWVLWPYFCFLYKFVCCRSSHLSARFLSFVSFNSFLRMAFLLLVKC